MSMVAQVQSLHQQDTVIHLEKVEQRLDAATLKIESLEKQLRRCEDEKNELREQLVAADAELFVHRKTLAQAPKLKDEVRVIESSGLGRPLPCSNVFPFCAAAWTRFSKRLSRRTNASSRLSSRTD